MTPPLPDFRSPAFLREHMLHTMAFYDDRCVDPAGGFFHFYRDDGTVFDATTRHLVSSTRFVITHAWMLRHFPQHPRASAWRAALLHGLRFVEQVHRNPATGGYAWLLRVDGQGAHVLDATNHCYGLAFVLLSHAEALKSGVTSSRAAMQATFDRMERHFWEPAQRLYADEADAVSEAAWSDLPVAADAVPAAAEKSHAAHARWRLSPYRGQNANMHACEAMLAAFEATGEAHYLARATSLAESVTVKLAALAGGLIWEHYRVGNAAASAPWVPDWHYNRNDRSNIFRPWGFQTGHLTEWAKLLLQLERCQSASAHTAAAQTAEAHTAAAHTAWLLPRAIDLFDAAMREGADHQHGGYVYGFAPVDDAPVPYDHGPYTICDAEKYHWVQAETLAAAAALAQRTGEPRFWMFYDTLWAYVWTHFVDHTHGAWYRILSADNRKLTDQKSPAGKVDYHNLGACVEALRAVTA